MSVFREIRLRAFDTVELKAPRTTAQHHFQHALGNCQVPGEQLFPFLPAEQALKEPDMKDCTIYIIYSREIQTNKYTLVTKSTGSPKHQNNRDVNISNERK